VTNPFHSKTRDVDRSAHHDPVVITYRAAAYPAVENAVLEAFAAGTPVSLDLDASPALDDDGVKGLIKLLRRGRDADLEVALQTQRPEHRERLAVTALDRLFPIVGTKEAA
jgi:sugar/nucleoside kinase (ribokinase family)